MRVRVGVRVRVRVGVRVGARMRGRVRVRVKVRARGDASEVGVHVEGRPLVDVQGSDLQAEDRLEVGVPVRGLIDDLAPVERLLVRTLGLP